MKRTFTLLAIAAVIGLGPAGTATADNLQAKPSVFVGKAGDCGPGYDPGSQIVTSAWLDGIGLPDDGGMNGVAATRKDDHSGLLLSKNGPIADCSAAGATIKGLKKGMTVGAGFMLGFDYRNGSHCGGGAPRFNVVSRMGGVETFHFVGNCSVGTSTPAPQDSHWTQLRFSAAMAFPPIAVGSEIMSISINFDEGTSGGAVPADITLAVIDNIFIDGNYIRDGHGHDD